MSNQPLFIKTEISTDIVRIMRSGLLQGKANWSTKEVVDELKKIYGGIVKDSKIRYILEQNQGCEFTPWWKSTIGGRVIWQLHE